MQIRELSHPMTSKKLNESLATKFGYKIKLEQFSDVQLEDARNKLRTRISQFEINESYDAVLENTDYQKTRMFLDVVNQEITEREMTSAEKGEEKKIKQKTDKSDMKKSMKKEYGKDKGRKIYFATIRKRAMDEAVPESWISNAIKRIELGESDRAELKAELKVRYDLNESQASYILLESEEEKAEIILATKDLIDRITGWIDNVANAKGEQILELLDSIRSHMGSDVAQQYEQAVKPSLESIYAALETARSGLSTGLSIVSGGEAPAMGATPPTEEIGGADMMPAATGEEPSAISRREQRESVDYSRRLGLMLSSKKK